MSIPKWLEDIDKQAVSMPFGVVDITVQRHRSKTVVVTYNTNAKIRYSDNEKAFSDLEKLINSMISATLTGKLSFEVDFKEGTIQEITIKNKDIKNYQE